MGMPASAVRIKVGWCGPQTSKILKRLHDENPGKGPLYNSHIRSKLLVMLSDLNEQTVEETQSEETNNEGTPNGTEPDKESAAQEDTTITDDEMFKDELTILQEMGLLPTMKEGRDQIIHTLLEFEGSLERLIDSLI